MANAKASPLAIAIAVIVLILVIFVIYKMTVGKSAPKVDDNPMVDGPGGAPMPAMPSGGAAGGAGGGTGGGG